MRVKVERTDVSYKVTLDLADEQWEHLQDYPREEWASVLNDGDERILSLP